MKEENTRQVLHKVLDEIPEDLLEEVYHYISHLKEHRDDTESHYASESTLGRDWNRSEEDEAWKDL